VEAGGSQSRWLIHITRGPACFRDGAKRGDGQISLLLADINMPGTPVSGVELADAVESELLEIPVLFVSYRNPGPRLRVSPKSSAGALYATPRISDFTATWGCLTSVRNWALTHS